MSTPQIHLEHIERIPAYPQGAHIALLQKCIVALDSQGHESGMLLLVEKVDEPISTTADVKEYCFQVCWTQPVDDILRDAHQDLFESVEDSAKALGSLLITELTQYTTRRQALRGTGVDYYLVNPNASLPFQPETTATVEFTGILNDVSSVERRINKKKKRLQTISNPLYPVFIVCVEHSFPFARMEKVSL